jgi:transposase
MTYPVPIINLFIKHTLNNIKVSKISEYLDISIPTLNKWYLKYKENIDNQTFLPENTNLKNTRSTNKILVKRSFRSFKTNH